MDRVSFWMKFFLMSAATMAALAAMTVFGGVPAAAPQVLRYNVAAEPETLDPAKATGIPEATVILNCFDGLVRTDPS
ncbi:MAG: peptide ABC transporter substrate-binding protein, partial [Candidatus Sumerlaeia bacterium]|nr:peptide ABC transporter substrate-binding protein [Candidatus Sumerlaeia bacterium]